MRTLVVSSRNPHKLAELEALLEPLGLQLTTAAEVGIPDVEETGETFEDNALLKAAAAFERTGGLCLADDSGLEVDALGGAPGVYSARFAGEDVTYADNNRLLVDKLAGLPAGERGAAFVCTIALLAPGDLPRLDPPEGATWRRVERPDVPAGATLYIMEGRVSGRILEAPRGEAGFGYDPLFFYEPLKATFAELPPETKNGISHRGEALAALAACVAALLD